MRHLALATLLIVSMFTTLCWAQTSAISGAILDPKDKALGNALVTANFSPISGAPDPKTRNPRAATDKSGNFSFTNLPAGVYRICVPSSDPDLLDPCQWSVPVMARVAANQNVSGLRIRLEQGVRLQIRIDDTGQLLSRNEGKTKGAHLSLGVWTASNLFRAIPVTGKDNSGRDHAIYVPQDRAIRLSAFSKYFRLAEPPNLVVHVPSKGAQQKFTVTGVK